MSATASKARRIKLYCPLVKKIVEMVAWDEQRIDMGSIALVFGLDPTTLKLNGHFISRGLDLISSSVTWNSLRSFFSAKRLSTGKDDDDALVVDGKLSRFGSKRAHHPQNMRNSDSEDKNLVKSKKIREGNSGRLWNVYVIQRRWLQENQLLEDLSVLKKLEIKLQASYQILQDRIIGFSRSVSSSHGRCRPMSRNMKRTREDDVDEAILAAPYKKD